MVLQNKYRRVAANISHWTTKWDHQNRRYFANLAYKFCGPGSLYHLTAHKVIPFNVLRTNLQIFDSERLDIAFFFRNAAHCKGCLPRLAFTVSSPVRSYFTSKKKFDFQKLHNFWLLNPKK